MKASSSTCLVITDASSVSLGTPLDVQIRALGFFARFYLVTENSTEVAPLVTLLSGGLKTPWRKLGFDVVGRACVLGLEF